MRALLPASLTTRSQPVVYQPPGGESMVKASLNENSVFLKPRPYFLFEIRLSTHREQFGEDRRPLRAI